jgi:hypothetical protein
VHPLVVLSIADHYTRERVSAGAAGARCVGLLFGQQEGQSVHVLETVEMAYRLDKAQPEQPILEQEAVETDMELCTRTHSSSSRHASQASGSELNLAAC